MSFWTAACAGMTRWVWHARRMAGRFIQLKCYFSSTLAKGPQSWLPIVIGSFHAYNIQQEGFRTLSLGYPLVKIFAHYIGKSV